MNKQVLNNNVITRENTDVKRVGNTLDTFLSLSGILMLLVFCINLVAEPNLHILLHIFLFGFDGMRSHDKSVRY